MSIRLPRSWRAARGVLCIRRDSLGDVLMCTPAIRALRASPPGCRVGAEDHIDTPSRALAQKPARECITKTQVFLRALI